MNQERRQVLSHVLWIGGATDSDKTAVAQIIAKRCGYWIHDYDRRDRPQIEYLAQTKGKVNGRRAILALDIPGVHLL